MLSAALLNPLNCRLLRDPPVQVQRNSSARQLRQLRCGIEPTNREPVKQKVTVAAAVRQRQRANRIGSEPPAYVATAACNQQPGAYSGINTGSANQPKGTGRCVAWRTQPTQQAESGNPNHFGVQYKEPSGERVR